MTVEDTVAEVMAEVGIWWPHADESDLRAAADAWDTFAAALDTAAQGGSAAANMVTTANTGPGIDAFEAFWSRYNGSCFGYLPSTSHAARDLARMCRDYADAVDQAKREVLELALTIGATLAAGVGFAILTFGASQAAATAIAATLVSRATLIGAHLSVRAGAIAKTVVGTTMSTVEAAAVSVTVAQPIRVEIFGRGGYSLDQLTSDMAYGAALGPLGGSMRSVRASAAAGAAQRTPKLTVEPGVTLSHSEQAGADFWLAQGHDVHAPLPAGSKGIRDVRTADLRVSGVGRVDVYAPEFTTGASGLVTAILKKSGQCDVIHLELVASSVPTEELLRIPRRVFGHPTAGKGIKRIVVRVDGRVVLDEMRRP